MKLKNKRLLCVVEAVTEHKRGDVLADIGTDHAYLPCFLYNHQVIKKAYACDIAEGPLSSSRETIKEMGASGVEALLGDGLDPIVNREVDMIAICGMGGLLMSQILDAHREMLDNHLFFLQANTAIDLLRGYLEKHDMAIIDEYNVKDAHHIYEVIVASKGKDVHYSEADLVFGPILRKQKNALFYEKWERILNTQNKILAQMDQTHEKYQEILAYKRMIEKELCLRSV
jgi:tRNA (adenine22-N1)-methyltransferase